MSKKFNDYFEFIELLNPNNLLNRIINLIIKNKIYIEKIINEYGFNNALIPIERFVNRYYNEEIIRKLENTGWSQKINF